ncbi:MAG: metal ABC transporter solute-binding protein, Zn/Mn family [Pleurocapsa sp.]
MLNKLEKKNILGFAAMSCIAWLIGNGVKSSDNIAQANDKPQIVAKPNILCDLIDTVAEDTVDLTCLIDPNRDPHTYSPTPSQRQAMEKAELILYGGYQLEPQIIQLIEATETSAPKLPVYEQGVAEPILREHKKHEDHEGHEEAVESTKKELKPDPHVWHNIENAVATVELIQPILLQLNPQQAAKYLQNSNVLIDRLWQVDAWIDEQIATIPEGKKVLVTTHDSLHYYVQAYGLEDYQTLQGISSESSPTASQLKDLAAEIKRTGVSTIFVEATTNSDRVMSNVARTAEVELSSEKLITDGLGEADNYIEMISHNTCAIVNGLQGKCQAFKDK